MKAKREIISRIPSHYVGEDCIQVTMAYKGNMVVLSPKKIIYQDIKGEALIYKYLEDERRKQFPYSNIPIHNRKVFLSNFKFANQLLDFETPYLRMSAQGFVENYAIKDKGEALLVSKFLGFNGEYIKDLTRQELEELFVAPTSDNENKYILYKGKFVNATIIPSEDEIVQWYKNLATKSLFEGTNRDFKTFEKLVNNASVEDLPENLCVINNVIVIYTTTNNITMQNVSIKLMNPNHYQVRIQTFPINKYILEQLKGATKVYNVKEPRISPRLNPNISVGDINLAKKFVLEKKA